MPGAAWKLSPCAALCASGGPGRGVRDRHKHAASASHRDDPGCSLGVWKQMPDSFSHELGKDKEKEAKHKVTREEKLSLKLQPLTQFISCEEFDNLFHNMHKKKMLCTKIWQLQWNQHKGITKFNSFFKSEDFIGSTSNVISLDLVPTDGQDLSEKWKDEKSYTVDKTFWSRTSSFCVSLISSRPIQPSPSPTSTPASFNGAGRREARVHPPLAQGLRYRQLAAASRPRHRATHADGGHTDCGRRQRRQAEGQGQGSGRPPRGSHGGWAPPEGREKPGRSQKGDRSGGRGAPRRGRDPHLLSLRDRHRGRQKKVCWMPANSGSGRWASRDERSTRRCSEAVELCAGEAAAQLYFNIIFLPGEIWVDFSFVTSLSRF
ncbi:hypothetical protein MG293_019601 [Ovis ammon polii]|uniref:Uncharacterized protein n=1 Tax=Ovis ammon polii TaxID=230172 RepID=A0AAD4Y1K3_OVIAM|nr:hypothetical protein MG293_019601 [Ovis ammon polii]